MTKCILDNKTNLTLWTPDGYTRGSSNSQSFSCFCPSLKVHRKRSTWSNSTRDGLNERSKPLHQVGKNRKSLACFIVTLSLIKQRPIRPKTAAFKLRTREKRVFVKQSVIQRKVTLLIHPCDVFSTPTCLGYMDKKNYYTCRPIISVSKLANCC